MPAPTGGPKPKGVKTSSLKSRILNVATPNNFIVKLQPPRKVLDFLDISRGLSYRTHGEEIELRCYRTTLPGSSFLTHSVSADFQGQVEEIPYRRGYDSEISMSFIVDTDYKVMEFFEGWMDYMSGIGQGTADFNSEYYNPGATYRMNYYEDYICDIFITKFEKDSGNSTKNNRYNKPHIEYNLLKAYPKIVNPIEVSYGPAGEFMSLDVTFGYSRYVRRLINN